ncbi:MAG: iron-containing alcohol dehydrogenase [Bryobacterales bacterium]|nr:iron-containing alcohol dehydrogenase [Bryobacterales bacterium]
MRGFDAARRLLAGFKGGKYVHGAGVLPQAGASAAAVGKRVALIRDAFPGSEVHERVLLDSLAGAGVEVAGVIGGAAPNAPRGDVLRIAAGLKELDPEAIVSFGGGSTIDAAKAAEVLRTLGGEIDLYFGTGMVAKALEAASKRLTPHLAIMTAASSSAHLTKYSNITDVATGQKKLIVDDAVTPSRALFDYGVTAGAPRALTIDGGLDGISHCLEVLYSAVGKPTYPLMEQVASEGIGLVLEYLPKALADPHDIQAREGLGLATDLGGYAIMVGGTSGAHLTSFSLVDILSHGRACGLMNPYYMVFFAPAVEEPLKLVAGELQRTGHAEAAITSLRGRALGEAVARALLDFMRKAGAPVTLREVPGFSEAHIGRALAAAKDPQLKMKLENMPVPLTAEMVDEYMGPILRAAATGDLSRIRNV